MYKTHGTVILKPENIEKLVNLDATNGCYINSEELISFTGLLPAPAGRVRRSDPKSNKPRISGNYVAFDFEGEDWGEICRVVTLKGKFKDVYCASWNDNNSYEFQGINDKGERLYHHFSPEDPHDEDENLGRRNFKPWVKAIPKSVKDAFPDLF